MKTNQWMKYLTTVLTALFLIGVGTVSAATLVWDASNGTVEGYKVYYNTSTASPGNSIDVGNATQFNLDTLGLTENVEYYFCVSAYNAAGESNPCSPVAYTQADTTPPAPPVGLVAE